MPPKRFKPEQRLSFRLTPQERELRFTDKEAVPDGAVEEARPFTIKQGQYLAFIYYYTKIHGMPPAESDFQRFFRVTLPSVIR